MELLILGPTTRQAYSIEWLEVETDRGNFVIRPGHAPMILVPSPNKALVFCLKDGKKN